MRENDKEEKGYLGNWRGGESDERGRGATTGRICGFKLCGIQKSIKN